MQMFLHAFAFATKVLLQMFCKNRAPIVFIAVTGASSL